MYLRSLRGLRVPVASTAFALVDGVLLGRLEFDISETTREAQRVTVAHELAHAVEMALMPRATTRALAQRLLAASGRHPLSTFLRVPSFSS